MKIQELKSTIEALLFASDEPLKKDTIREVLPDEDPRQIDRCLTELMAEYDYGNRGMLIKKLAGGYQMLTRPEFDSVLEVFFKVSRRYRMTMASLETLAIVAYHQPITMREIEAYRGVNADGVVRTLHERGFLKTLGRRQVPGRPFLWGTTEQFLTHFGLNSIQDLPDQHELEEFLKRVNDEKLSEEQQIEEPETNEEDLE